MATVKIYFEFHIVKWEDNKLLEKHKMTVQRQSHYNAVTVVRRKYSPQEGYFEELNRKWIK